MPTDEWRTVRLGEVADDVTVGHVGSMAAEYVETGIPFLRSLNIEPHRIDLAGVKFVSPEFHARLKKSALKPGDVVTVRTGKPGATAVVPDHLPAANCSDVVITRPGPNLDPRWLSYYINGVATGYISSRLVGAVQQHFNVGSAKEMVLAMPPLAEQRGIAATLGALDDKIESNRRGIDLAEQLGDAHFAAVADGVATLSAVAEITMGSSPPGTSYNEDGVGMPFYQGVRDFGRRYPGYRVWTTAPVRTAEPNDTLLSVRAPVGSLNRSRDICCIGRGVAAIRSGFASTLYYALRAADNVWQPFQDEGTVFGAINKADLAAATIPWPSQGRQLDEALSALDNAIQCSVKEMETLVVLRDALLPELLSGRIRVPEAAQAVAEVGA